VQKWKPRLYIDADVTEEALAYLGDRYNTLTARELGWSNRDDDFQAQYARRERRILVTQNERDFWDDRKHPLHTCPGIVVVPSSGGALGVKVAVALVQLLNILKYLPPEAWLSRKIKAAESGCTLKQIGPDGKTLVGRIDYEFGEDIVWDREV
jgi:hypothetical protein